MKKLHKIAIVDPNQDLAKAYQKRLKLDGFEVYVFNSAEEATTILYDMPFDAVISEYSLPDMKFIDFYDLLQTISSVYSIPVIILSAEQLRNTEDMQLVDFENFFVKSKTHPNEIVDRLRFLLKV